MKTSKNRAKNFAVQKTSSTLTYTLFIPASDSEQFQLAYIWPANSKHVFQLVFPVPIPSYFLIISVLVLSLPVIFLVISCFFVSETLVQIFDAVSVCTDNNSNSNDNLLVVINQVQRMHVPSDYDSLNAVLPVVTLF